MDLIDRQAAIDALKRYSLGETDAVKLEMRMYDYLKRVASAQPYIIRCKDCKHSFLHNNGERTNRICGRTRMCGTTPDDWYYADAEPRRGEEKG